MFCCFSPYRAVEKGNQGAGQNHPRMTAYRVVQTLYSPIASSLKRQTCARNAPRTRDFTTLRDDRHAWTDRNSLTGKGRK